MKLLVPKGAQSLLVDIFIPDTTSVAGNGKTGLTNASAGLTAYYHRNLAASPVQITLAAASVGTWSSGGFKEVSAANMPGVYQLGIPNAAVQEGADSVVVMLKGAADMAPVLLEIQLTDQAYQAKIWVTDDNANNVDRYLVRWYADDQMVTSGIGTPTIEVIRADGVTLIAETAMTDNSGRLTYAASGAQRIASGQSYEVIVRATLNGAVRTFSQQVSRDS